MAEDMDADGPKDPSQQEPMLFEPAQSKRALARGARQAAPEGDGASEAEAPGQEVEERWKSFTLAARQRDEGAEKPIR